MSTRLIICIVVIIAGVAALLVSCSSVATNLGKQIMKSNPNCRYSSVSTNPDGSYNVRVTAWNCTGPIDLSAVSRQQINSIMLIGCDLKTLSFIKGKHVNTLWLTLCPTQHIESISDITVDELVLEQVPVTSVDFLGGRTFRMLTIYQTAISNLASLSNISVTNLFIDNVTIGRMTNGLDCLRSVPGLQTINEEPARQFIESWTTN